MSSVKITYPLGIRNPPSRRHRRESAGLGPGHDLTLLRDRSEAGDVDDGLGEGLRRFLGQVVPYSAADLAVLVLAAEFGGVGGGLWVRRAVGVAFHGDGRH